MNHIARLHRLLAPAHVLALALPLTAAACSGPSVTTDTPSTHIALRAVQVSMAEALDVARAHQAGDLFEAEFEERGEGSVYEVEILAADGVHEVVVSAASGEVLSSELDPEDLQAATHVAQSVSAAQWDAALTAATSSSEGRVFALSYREGGVLVDMLEDGGALRYRWDVTAEELEPGQATPRVDGEEPDGAEDTRDDDDVDEDQVEVRG